MTVDALRGEDAELVSRHQNQLRSYLRWLGAAGDAIDDIVQDTFVACFTQRPATVTGAWLRTVARHLLQRRRVRAATRSTLTLDEAAAAWERHCAEGDGDGFRGALRECLRAVNERQGQALRWRYGENLPTAAIAANLGITAAGTETLLRRLRQQLRTCIERRLA